MYPIRGKNLYLKKKRNNKVIVSTIIIAILVIVISSYSYALWSTSDKQEGYNQVSIGCLDLSVEDNKPINLVNAYQLSDNEALEQVPYTFKVTNNCNTTEYVSIQLDMKSSNTLSTNNLRASLTKDNNYVVWPSTISELEDSNNINVDGYNTAKKLEIEKIDGNTTKEYNLYLWIDEDTPYEQINNKTFESKIEIVNTEAPENSNPTKWHITYDLDGGTLTKINRTEYDENDINFTLSTPTKEGYTFAGWSGGKNLFDEETILMSIEDAIYENDYYVLNYWNTSIKYENGVDIIRNIKPNQQYVISFKGHITDERYYLRVHYADGSYFTTGINSKEDSEYIFITSIDKNVSYFALSYSNNGIDNFAYIKYIQIEEGTEATTYEPYINNQKTVVIPKGSTGNRTYTANWIANN
ncbi:MAG: InlB B-repeat-containing protein [Bacilli bacterium]|nr:InlB B-repeat-containing protein [Bacilli bacterium]